MLIQSPPVISQMAKTSLALHIPCENEEPPHFRKYKDRER